MQETIVISLGGSIIIPENLDIEFLKSFKKVILSEIEKGKKFAIVTGGGKLCRKYNEGALEISNLSSDDLDWLGIYTTRLNAEFMRLIFGDEITEKKIILDPTSSINFSKKLIFGGGWMPGSSTDLATILVAKQIGAKRVINLSNIDYVYDSDPKLNPNAKKLDKISWEDYLKLIPNEWKPGLNSPFDPVASKMAQKEGLEVVIMNGKPVSNFIKLLNGEKFEGTIIS